MATKSDIVFQRALYFKDRVADLQVIHYSQDRYRELVDEIFRSIFNAELEIDHADQSDHGK
ncbi:MAG: hypothetical protein CL489_17785 [Acidobacteria bacterium]|nr:hypothetical protein [Acidobacteriota bacterium]